MNNITSPNTSDSAVEQQIQAKGKTAFRVTPADVQSSIASEHYFTAAEGESAANSCYGNVGDSGPPALGLLTFCVLVLKNGFTVTGESVCASPKHFDAETGCKIARQNAEQKIWPLLGYELKTLLARPVLTMADADADLAGTPRPSKHG